MKLWMREQIRARERAQRQVAVPVPTPEVAEPASSASESSGQGIVAPGKKRRTASSKEHEPNAGLNRG